MAISKLLTDGEEITLRANGQEWIVSWHPPHASAEGRPHGAQGICVTSPGVVVLVSRDYEHWELPAGRPDGDETWEQTLRREMLEEACATVVQAELLGFSRGVCVAGPEEGLVLVRSMWRAEVDLEPWKPEFEIAHRRVVAPEHLAEQLALATHPFAPIIRRAFHEAGIGLPDRPTPRLERRNKQ